jgi:hypothetical protein
MMVSSRTSAYAQSVNQAADAILSMPPNKG